MWKNPRLRLKCADVPRRSTSASSTASAILGCPRDLGIYRKEAAAYIEGYLDTYPGVRRYMEEVVEHAKEQGYVETLLHRRRYLPELKSANFNVRSFGKRVALNTPIQGTAADIIKIAMIRVRDALKEKCPEARLILQVHDELVVETPEALRVGCRAGCTGMHGTCHDPFRFR